MKALNPIHGEKLSQRLRRAAPSILNRRLWWQFRDGKGVWQDYRCFWAQLTPFMFRPNDELFEHNFSLLDSKPLFHVIMRYQRAVNKNLRLRHGARHFRILQLTDVDEAGVMHRAVVEEIVNEYE